MDEDITEEMAEKMQIPADIPEEDPGAFEPEDVEEEPEQESNFVIHARRELEILGEDPDIIEKYLNVIRAFAAMDHSGGSASIAIPVIAHLLQFKNLKPLTSDPDEWFLHEKAGPNDTNLWQNKRNAEAFSTNGGKTYQLMSESSDKKRAPIHYSQAPEIPVNEKEEEVDAGNPEVPGDGNEGSQSIGE